MKLDKFLNESKGKSVWIVEGHKEYGLIGIFSTKEKAEEYKKIAENFTNDKLFVDEMTLDQGYPTKQL